MTLLPQKRGSVVNRLCLGTVKLGMPDYGFSSTSTLPPLDTAHFLAQVEEAGIHCFDTSPRYGNSESSLGTYLKDRAAPPPFVSSKIDNLTHGRSDTPQQMLESVQSSLAKLHLTQLDLCYLHQNDITILRDPFVHEGLQRLKYLGLIRSAGVSVYHREECEYALDSGMYDFIQIPVNIFDLGFYNRFIETPSHTSVRFTARSLLLQGILANRETISGRIRQGKEIHAYLHSLDRIAARWEMTTTEMALRFVFSLPHIDHFLIGSLSIHNLRENLTWTTKELPPDIMTEIKAMASQEKTWTNPRNW